MSHPLLRSVSNSQSSVSPREKVIHTSRGDFVREFGESYGNGQHVTFIGPTQRGKTYLSHQLLGAVISPERQAVILSGKPPGRDGTMSKAAASLNLRVVTEWPPPSSVKPGNWRKNVNGYVLQPKQTMDDIDGDTANLRYQYRKAIMGNYRSKVPVITVADEAHHVQNDLKLRKEYEAPLMRGAPVNAMWSLIQRGRYMTYLAYDAPEHVFIFYDPDRSNQRRYADIGGADPATIAKLAQQLNTTRSENGGTISECLYFRRSNPEQIEIVGIS